MSFFNYLFNPESSGTLILYFCITCAVFLFGCCAQQKVKSSIDGKAVYKFNKGFYILAFLVLWFFAFFNNVGTDLSTYLKIYNTASISLMLEDVFVEPGFRFLCILIKCVVSDAYIGVGLIKTITLLLIFYSGYKLREQIHMGFFIVAYTILFYFESFNLIRISLAAALILLAWVLFGEQKPIKSLFLIILAISVHYSAIIAIPVILLFPFVRKEKSHIIIAVMLVFTLLAIIFAPMIINWLVANVPFLNKYENYLQGSGTVGIMQFIFYVPVAAVCLYWRGTKENEGFNKTALCIAGWGLLVALLGYNYGMIARMNVYFGYNFMVLIPLFMQKLRQRQCNCIKLEIDERYKLSYDLTWLIVCAYFLIRFVLDIAGYMEGSGIYPFIFWF